MNRTPLPQSEKKRVFLVNEEALPEVFVRVVEAKRLLTSGECLSATKAAEKSGISRSVFYKYRDAVHLYTENSAMRVVTLSATLLDRAGVLSSFIDTLTDVGANILSINQSLPIGSVAVLNVSIRTEELKIPLNGLITRLKELGSVRSIFEVIEE